MSQQNKTTLQSAINTLLADNTSGDISAADVRDNLINMTDSLLFNSGSQGITGSLTATSFTGSLQGTATTASYVLNAISASYAATTSIADVATKLTITGAGGVGPLYPTLVGISAGDLNVSTKASNLSFNQTTNQLFATSISSSFTGSLRGTSSFATIAGYVSLNDGAIKGVNIGSTQMSNGDGAIDLKSSQTNVIPSLILGSSDYSNTVKIGSYASNSHTLSAEGDFLIEGDTGITISSPLTDINYAGGTTIINNGASGQIQLTGTTSVTGRLSATGGITGSFTGSLQGTASYATVAQTLLGSVTSASYAATASMLLGSIESASYASFALSSSYPIAVSGSSLYSTYFTPQTGFTTNNGIYLGVLAGNNASSSLYSVFLGTAAGNNAPGAQYSTFVGRNAGANAGLAVYSVFIGRNAGQFSANAANSNFLGYQAGFSSANATNSNFLGWQAGQNAAGAFSSNFLGYQTGFEAISASYSNFLGNKAGNSAYTASNSNFFGSSAGELASNAYHSNFFGGLAGYNSSQANNSNFFGNVAGYQAHAANNSNFFGNNAGRDAYSASNSNFFGSSAGYQSYNAFNSNFFGPSAGGSAESASYSNFLGNQAGGNATYANNSNFFGDNAGNGATNAIHSNFIGQYSGYGATHASQSNFIGKFTGYNNTTAEYSNFIGYNVGNASYFNGTSRNNIIIGTNLTLETNRQDSINIGGIIFGTGSYFDTDINSPFSGSANGKIGINVPNPTTEFDVSGSIKASNVLSLAPQHPLPSGVATGSFAVSSSTPPKPYFWDGSAWNALY